MYGKEWEVQSSSPVLVGFKLLVNGVWLGLAC